jgi:IclR family transcriptional regulator, mhp operon transcriptional activator
MTKTIRSLERGLQVLSALHTIPIASLQDIYRLTTIPKPTLLRILLTLERAGAVSRRLADGRYRISTNLTRLARKRDRYDRVAEAAAPVLDRLCQKISWPSDLMVPAGDHMEIRETSRTQSPFATYYSKDRVGVPVNWLLSAVGRAYLAHCPDEERENLINLVRKSDKAENWLARDRKRLDEILSETRKRGYGIRDQGFLGGPYGAQLPDVLAAIAVPLLDGRRVHGVINIIWPKPAHTIEVFASRYLPELQAAAVEIVGSLRNRARR